MTTPPIWPALLSDEVIREFQVVKYGAVAEFGRASSGTISVVTRSGTNRASGRAYEFFRDDVFDASSPLSARKDPVSGAPLTDPLWQNQFGVGGGGPFVKDRTFWFGNLERTQLDRTGIVTVAPASVAAVNNTLDSVHYPGPRIQTGHFATGYNTTNVFGRVDRQATGSSRLQLRYSVYDVDSDNARTFGALNDVSRGVALRDTDPTLAVNYLSTR